MKWKPYCVISMVRLSGIFFTLIWTGTKTPIVSTVSIQTPTFPGDKRGAIPDKWNQLSTWFLMVENVLVHIQHVFCRSIFEMYSIKLFSIDCLIMPEKKMPCRHAGRITICISLGRTTGKGWSRKPFLSLQHLLWLQMEGTARDEAKSRRNIKFEHHRLFERDLVRYAQQLAFISVFSNSSTFCYTFC